ncbi:ArsR/SmtB family transcription factor [Methanobacterium congolense]|uniref:Regulatory protein ArsR n=1 Tax=Methanobacterium congolense TaxID=118062 RepID=A0A1D3L314_9EURY|nr:winged helix-turn-helix domain-containing protein [Methanobacterium congolense]SCG85958.1 Regulatory protein ArsR [Methanobacterium congolense]
MKKLLWWLIAGKRGGINRARIIKALAERPYNMHQLSEELNLDYKTVRHHIKILEKNKLIKPTGDKYGKLYFLSGEMEENYGIFEEIWEKIGVEQSGEGH